MLVDVPAPDRADAAVEPAVETRPGRKLRNGSTVVVIIPPELRLEVSPYAVEDLVILHEDERTLVVDKPPGLAVHPAGRHLTDTLIQRVHARYRTEPGARVPIKLCHRLDRETSGVILLAKDAEAHTALMQDFEHRRIGKQYLAIVRGNPEADEGVIDFPLAPARASEVRIKMAVASDGMEARTDWRVLERHEGCALLLCEPHTGRQHQIRVHMEAIGHPLVGDKLYGRDEDTFLRNALGELTREELRDLGLARHALHNHSLTFRVPGTETELRVESPLAADMRAYLEAL